MGYFDFESLFTFIENFLANFGVDNVDFVKFIGSLSVILAGLALILTGGYHSIRIVRRIRVMRLSKNNDDIVSGFCDEKDNRLTIRLQKIDEVPGCLILYITGYIDMYNANYFQKRVAKAIESGFTRLIFHLAGFNMVSDEIIICFAVLLKAVKPSGGDLVLTEIPPKVYEVFQLLGFSQFFNIKENLEKAVGFFSQK